MESHDTSRPARHHDRPSGTHGYPDLIQRAAKHRIPGTTTDVPVASAADIIASKAAAGRPKDMAMLPALHKELAPWLEREPEPNANTETEC